MVLVAMKLFSKYSNRCDQKTRTLQTDGRTDRQTDARFAVAVPRSVKHRAVKILEVSSETKHDKNVVL